MSRISSGLGRRNVLRGAAAYPIVVLPPLPIADRFSDDFDVSDDTVRRAKAS